MTKKELDVIIDEIQAIANKVEQQTKKEKTHY